MIRYDASPPGVHPPIGLSGAGLASGDFHPTYSARQSFSRLLARITSLAAETGIGDVVAAATVPEDASKELLARL